MSSYVLDASVAVAAVRTSERSHREARARLGAVLTGADLIIVPVIFDVEVVSALVRGGGQYAAVREFLDRDLGTRQLVSIGPREARAISSLAAAARLRAADAAYVWVANSRGLPLVTLDLEVQNKAGSLCRVETP